MTLRSKFQVQCYHYLIQLENFVSHYEIVIEDIRMHRVVFCKSMTFRWFADVEPKRGGVIIKIQKSRKDPIQIIQIEKDQEISEYTQVIKDAFEGIH